MNHGRRGRDIRRLDGRVIDFEDQPIRLLQRNQLIVTDLVQIQRDRDGLLMRLDNFDVARERVVADLMLNSLGEFRVFQLDNDTIRSLLPRLCELHAALEIKNNPYPFRITSDSQVGDEGRSGGTAHRSFFDEMP